MISPPNVPTVSAFNQQRSKVLPEAFEYLFHDYMEFVPHKEKTFHGYRLIACDGSNLTVVTNPKDVETYVKTNQFAGNGNRLHLKSKDEFDTDVKIHLTRSQSKANKEADYKFMPVNQVFDYLPVGSKGTYTITFRVVCFQISENNYETIITNLDRRYFKPKLLKEVYGMRWGIETPFR